MARERKGDGGRGERSEGEERGRFKRKDEKKIERKRERERRALREGARPVNQCQMGFIKCIVGMLCLNISVCHYVSKNSQ